jgi:hypothetical protein
MYFRQFCGRFVRTIGGGFDEREAYVFVPDDQRIRTLATRITADVRTVLREREERAADVTALDAAQRPERASDEGHYASIAAVATEGRVLDFGPLFNPTAYFAAGERDAAQPASPPPASPPPAVPPALTYAERKDALRRAVHALVARVSTHFGVDHKLVHATLNERCGGPVATASEHDLERRRRQAELWLTRRVYDGFR